MFTGYGLTSGRASGICFAGSSVVRGGAPATASARIGEERCMNEPVKAVGAEAREAVEAMAAPDAALPASGRSLFDRTRDLAGDTIAGLLASVVLIGNILSFGALMFPGELSHGLTVAVWAMLIG